MAQNIICPHCKLQLALDGRTYKCNNNHCFDLSKEGYLNLLPVNKKKSKAPGDNELMISARRNFLEQGFYNPLIFVIKNIISDNLNLKDKKFFALDSGCGEGYYSQFSVKQASTNCQVLGTDISKFAVKSAAKKYKDNFYFVSSVYQLPVANNSMDLILSVFAPNDPTEFNRILKENGHLIIVSPAKNHMKQLAELIYDSFRPHQHKIVSEMPDSFTFDFSERVSFEIEINDANTLSDLHKMTPYYYNTSKEAQVKIATCDSIKIDCDFHISVFKPNKPSDD